MPRVIACVRALQGGGQVLLVCSQKMPGPSEPEGSPGLAVRAANVDLEASSRSIDAAKALRREGGATVWLHHDLEAQQNVRIASSFYR